MTKNRLACDLDVCFCDAVYKRVCCVIIHKPALAMSRQVVAAP